MKSFLSDIVLFQLINLRKQRGVPAPSFDSISDSKIQPNWTVYVFRNSTQALALLKRHTSGRFQWQLWKGGLLPLFHFFVFSVLWQNNEETTGQKSEFPQAGGVHDSSDDGWASVFKSSLLFKCWKLVFG